MIMTIVKISRHILLIAFLPHEYPAQKTCTFAELLLSKDGVTRRGDRRLSRRQIWNLHINRVFPSVASTLRAGSVRSFVRSRDTEMKRSPISS